MIVFLALLLTSSEVWALCVEMVKPVESSVYTGTPADFLNGFSVLYRDRYTDTGAACENGEWG